MCGESEIIQSAAGAALGAAAVDVPAMNFETHNLRQMETLPAEKLSSAMQILPQKVAVARGRVAGNKISQEIDATKSQEIAREKDLQNIDAAVGALFDFRAEKITGENLREIAARFPNLQIHENLSDEQFSAAFARKKGRKNFDEIRNLNAFFHREKNGEMSIFLRENLKNPGGIFAHELAHAILPAEEARNIFRELKQKMSLDFTTFAADAEKEFAEENPTANFEAEVLSKLFERNFTGPDGAVAQRITENFGDNLENFLRENF